MGSAFMDGSPLGFVLRLVLVAACHFVFSCKVAASGGCRFPALFSFGTSLSDTGNGVLTNRIFNSSAQFPYGETYFGRPSGRFCDGRIMLDFLAQSIGLPLVKPYLAHRTAGTDFSQGVNYAVSGATVQGPVYLLRQGDISFLTLDSLDAQIGWHLAIQQAVQSPELAASSYPGVILPSPSAIANGLYYLEFGGNDYGTYFLSKYLFRPAQRHMDIDNSYALSNLVPIVVQKIVSAIESLYANSARNFIVFSILPESCAPLFLKLLNGTKDATGCLSAFNEVTVVHNQQLSVALDGLRSKYPDVNLLIADDYGAYLKVVQNPTQYGFFEAINACCGAGPKVPYQFELSKTCSSRSYLCTNPSSYVLWDGIHNTKAMNHYIINSIVSGEYLNPFDGLKCASSV